MKRLGIIMMLGAALGLSVLANPREVHLPPAEEEIAALRAALDGVAKVLESFIGELKGAVGILSANDQDLLAKYRAVAVQLKDLEAKIFRLQEVCTRVPALEKNVNELLGRTAELRKALDEAIAQARAADAELWKSLKDVTAKLEAVHAECRNISAALAEQIAQFGQQLAALDKRVTTLESYDIGNLSRRVLKVEQAIQAVQIKIENNREKIVALEKTIAGFTADISALKESILKLETRISDQDTKIAALEQTVGKEVKDTLARLDMIQMVAILGLLAGIGAIILVLTGVGR